MGTMTADDDPGTSAPAEGLGLAAHPLAEIRARVLDAWTDLMSAAAAVDLAAPTRVPGWRAHDLLVHLGDWPDHHVLDRALDSARSGGHGDPVPPDAANTAVIAAHRDDDGAAVLAALAASYARLERFFDGGEADELGHLPALTSVGRLPVLGLVQAGCYEMAVHLLDLAPTGAPAPRPATLDSGVAALVDVTGSLAARHRVDLGVTAQTPGRRLALPCRWARAGPPSGSRPVRSRVRRCWGGPRTCST